MRIILEGRESAQSGHFSPQPIQLFKRTSLFSPKISPLFIPQFHLSSQTSRLLHGSTRETIIVNLWVCEIYNFLVIKQMYIANCNIHMTQMLQKFRCNGVQFSKWFQTVKIGVMLCISMANKCTKNKIVCMIAYRQSLQRMQTLWKYIKSFNFIITPLFLASSPLG